MVVDLLERRRAGETRESGGDHVRFTGSRRALTMGVGVVAVLFALGGTVRIVQIGHSGAKATWEDNKLGVVLPGRSVGSQSGDGDGDRD